MKRWLMFSVIALIVFSSCGDKKPISPHESSVGQGISVRYGRPYKKGRVIFGALDTLRESLSLWG